MVEVSTERKVIDVPRDRLDEAAGVLTQAFRDYPILRYVFTEGGKTDIQHVFETFRFITGVRMALGEPVKGIVQGDRLAAVACLDRPERQEWPEEMERAWIEFAGRIGSKYAERLERYGETTAPHRLSEPHYYVVVIGVLPELQGQGYGRRLLDEVHAMSEAHPTSTGVGLDTETTDNVAFYEHRGYRVHARTALEDVPVWCMFRPDSFANAPN